jgi:metallo-beta-lactamase class B
MKKIYLALALSLSLLAQSLFAQDDGDLHDPEQQRVAPFQVFDNLYYIGAEWVSSWLLVTDQGLIVFDAMYDELTDLAIEGIRELGFDPNDVRYLIVSHAHYDHVGGALRFQQEFAAVTMMTEEDWAMTEQPPVFREYPKPIRHLSASDGATLNLGRTRLRFMKTPGHTPGVLSTIFTVYDNGYPHTAMLFGGDGINFTGVDRLQMYVDSIERMQTLPDIEVHVSSHPMAGEIFERRDRLAQRQDGDPHPFVDPESWDAHLELRLRQARQQLAQEQAAAN